MSKRDPGPTIAQALFVIALTLAACIVAVALLARISQ